MSAHIDHFMYAVPDMDQGIAWAADLFGVEPVFGGHLLRNNCARSTTVAERQHG
jgi:hypothetical protein